MTESGFFGAIFLTRQQPWNNKNATFVNKKLQDLTKNSLGNEKGTGGLYNAEIDSETRGISADWRRD